MRIFINFIWHILLPKYMAYVFKGLGKKLIKNKEKIFTEWPRIHQ